MLRLSENIHCSLLVNGGFSGGFSLIIHYKSQLGTQRRSHPNYQPFCENLPLPEPEGLHYLPSQ
ncbi:hypothetical protein NIES39_C02790 [Arthrospira platensis NIES-39]|nr:hypothetical protein NIES39_C02790 [Arthrospira platensis NIES-39]